MTSYCDAAEVGTANYCCWNFNINNVSSVVGSFGDKNFLKNEVFPETKNDVDNDDGWNLNA